MEILALLKANIRYRKGSFISVFLLTFIISLCLTSIISIKHNVEERADISLELNHTGDLVAIIWDVRCPNSVLRELDANPGIEKTDVVKTLTQELKINGISKGSSTFFMPYDQEKLAYKIYGNNGLTFRENPEKLKPGEIYVPISFKQLYDSEIGDAALLTDGSNTRSFTIKGYFEEPFMGSEMTGIKLALMNEEDFNTLYKERLVSQEEKDSKPGAIGGFYLVHLFKDKSSTQTISELKRSINEETGIIDNSLLTISREQSKAYTVMLTQIISSVMVVFLILLFVVVLVVMGHSISTGIEMDYSNLGVLKAIGFDPGRLREVFVLEYMLAELTGAILGTAGSIPAIYYLNAIFVSMTGLLSSVKPALGICLLILAAILMVSALFIFLKTKAIIKISPVSAISGGKESVYFHSRLELPVEGKGLFFRMAFRQLTSNKKQYISSIITAGILVYFLVTITALSTIMDKQTIEESFGVTLSDIGVYYKPQENENQEEKEALRKRVEEDISKISPIEKAFVLGSTYFMVNGDKYHVSIYDDPTLIKSILKGRAPLYGNEVVMTENVAKELGVKLGDAVTVEYKGAEGEYIISGIYQSTTDMGKAIAISEEGAEKIIPVYSKDGVDYKIADSNKSAEIVKVLDENYGDLIEVEDVNAEDDFGNTIINSINALKLVIYTISVLFAFVVILIVCSKIFLKERTDYGIYKALGFSSVALRLQYSIRFAIIALAGSILGIGLNICLNGRMMSVLFSGAGITSFHTDYTIGSILLPTLLLTVCFFTFAYYVSRKMKKVNTRSLISNQ